MEGGLSSRFDIQRWLFLSGWSNGQIPSAGGTLMDRSQGWIVSLHLAQGGGFPAFWLERGGVHGFTVSKGGMTAE